MTFSTCSSSILPIQSSRQRERERRLSSVERISRVTASRSTASFHRNSVLPSYIQVEGNPVTQWVALIRAASESLLSLKRGSLEIPSPRATFSQLSSREFSARSVGACRISRITIFRSFHSGSREVSGSSLN